MTITSAPSDIVCRPILHVNGTYRSIFLSDWGFTPLRRENIGPPAWAKIRAKAAEGFQMYAALGRAGVGGARET